MSIATERVARRRHHPDEGTGHIDRVTVTRPVNQESARGVW
ncbi:hypothetical protein [Streptomyces niger]|nr:hypothetical protein [Streptomyces niger]